MSHKRAIGISFISLIGYIIISATAFLMIKKK